MEKAVGKVDMKQAISDLVELAARALLSGIAVGTVMGLAILALTTTAHAASLDAATGQLMLRSASGFTPAPKVSTEVSIEVKGIVARTRVTQVFHNPGAEFAEGVYVFPLPEKAAVDRLWMKIGERVVEGRIQERAEARATYEKARSEGRKAALVEQQRPNLFTNSVAHIGPSDRVEIKIEYQQALAYDQGRYRLRFPLAVTPRYDPMPDEPKAAEAALVPAVYRARSSGLVNPVDIVVTIDAGVPLADVVSSYHETAIEKSGRRVAVALAKEQEEADRDFELTWSVAPADAPRAALFTHRTAATDFALLMVVPPAATASEHDDARRLPRETILVVDTSGSMQGASMQQAKSALEQALKTLTPRDRFNLIEFNSTAHALWPAALPADARNLEIARAWVGRLQANGGTEMTSALDLALDGRESAGYLRQVVFITDGAVGNEEQLFRMISQRLGSSRLFTVGIGAAPNSHFMTRAAQFGRGTFTHIGDLREVHEKMSSLFAKIEAPVLRDVTVRFADGSAVETFPPRVPDLYLGEPVVVAAAAAAPLKPIVVSGLRGNQPWSVVLTPSPEGEAASVGALWARYKIASLMDEVVRGADPSVIRPLVVKVALEHHLVSAYTSLVAVDVTPTAPAGPVRSAMVAASVPNGMALPQTDTPAMLQLLIGLLALTAAAMLGAGARRLA